MCNDDSGKENEFILAILITPLLTSFAVVVIVLVAKAIVPVVEVVTRYNNEDREGCDNNNNEII